MIDLSIEDFPDPNKMKIRPDEMEALLMVFGPDCAVYGYRCLEDARISSPNRRGNEAFKLGRWAWIVRLILLLAVDG